MFLSDSHSDGTHSLTAEEKSVPMKKQTGDSFKGQSSAFVVSHVASSRFVGHFKSQKEREAEMQARNKEFTNIFIKNFGPDVDDEMLTEIFSRIR